MKNILNTLNSLLNKADKRMDVQSRMMDLASEVGELSKEVLKSTQYGKKEFVMTSEFKEEYGDVLYAILCMGIENGIDIEDNINKMINKMNGRFNTDDELSPSIDVTREVNDEAESTDTSHITRENIIEILSGDLKIKMTYDEGFKNDLFSMMKLYSGNVILFSRSTREINDLINNIKQFMIKEIETIMSVTTFESVTQDRYVDILVFDVNLLSDLYFLDYKYGIIHMIRSLSAWLHHTADKYTLEPNDNKDSYKIIYSHADTLFKYINNAYEFDTKKNKTKNEQDLENLQRDMNYFKKELGIYNNYTIYNNGR